MSDTVGFIDRLPHALVAAFRATLEEVADADLVLHVIDAAAPERDRRMAAVRRVLEEVGASTCRCSRCTTSATSSTPDERRRLRASRSDGAVHFGADRGGRRRAARADRVAARARRPPRDPDVRSRDDRPTASASRGSIATPACSQHVEHGRRTSRSWPTCRGACWRVLQEAEKQADDSPDALRARDPASPGVALGDAPATVRPAPVVTTPTVPGFRLSRNAAGGLARVATSAFASSGAGSSCRRAIPRERRAGVRRGAEAQRRRSTRRKPDWRTPSSRTRTSRTPSCRFDRALQARSPGTPRRWSAAVRRSSEPAGWRRRATSFEAALAADSSLADVRRRLDVLALRDPAGHA